jgi:hypothetical protein
VGLSHDEDIQDESASVRVAVLEPFELAA